MAKPNLFVRIKAILRAWPAPGAVFLVMAFFVTAAWFVNMALLTFHADAEKWLEPLAAMLTGIGAFLVVWILIGERIQSAVVDASVYGLARGLATGYYFNLIRPIANAIRDSESALYKEAATVGANRIGGIVVGVPETPEYFEPSTHARFLESSVLGGLPYTLHNISVQLEGRPRPIFLRLAVSTQTKVGIVLDIPTTLAVIPDFAKFVADNESSARGQSDDSLTTARADAIIASETANFEDWLHEEFNAVMTRFAVHEPPPRIPLRLLHVVRLPLLRRRMEEVAGH